MTTQINEFTIIVPLLNKWLFKILRKSTATQIRPRKRFDISELCPPPSEPKDLKKKKKTFPGIGSALLDFYYFPHNLIIFSQLILFSSQTTMKPFLIKVSPPYMLYEIC